MFAAAGLSPWLDLYTSQFILQHLAKCFVCPACWLFLSSQTTTLRCVDPFLLSHVWMSARLCHVVSTNYTHLAAGGDIGGQISVLMCSYPTEFLHLGIGAGSRCTRLQTNSQAIWSIKAFSLEQRLKLGTLVMAERNSPSVRDEKLNQGCCLALMPYTKGCLSDRIKLFSTWNVGKICWVLNWDQCLKTTQGWWTLPLMPDFPGLEINMLTHTISFC